MLSAQPRSCSPWRRHEAAVRGQRRLDLWKETRLTGHRRLPICIFIHRFLHLPLALAVQYSLKMGIVDVSDGNGHRVLDGARRKGRGVSGTGARGVGRRRRRPLSGDCEVEVERRLPA